MPDRRAGLAFAALLLLTSPVGGRPEAADAALSAAIAASNRGDGIAAEAALNKALEAGADRSDIAARMGEAQLLQGNLQKAHEWLDSGAFSQSDAALGWRMTGLLRRREGRLPEAGQAYDKALTFAPQDALLWVDIARLRYIGGEHLLAVEAADRALALAPDNPRTLELRAQLRNDQAGPIAAIPLFERGLRAAPADLQLLRGYAGALGEAGRATDMLKAVRRMARIDPRSAIPLYYQAIIAARAGKIDLAKNLLDRAALRLKGLEGAMLLESALELEAGNSAIAVNMLERLDRQQPFNQRVQLLYARALLAVDDHARLRERFGELAERSDAAPYLLTVLGRSYERTGEREAAASLLDRAATAALVSSPVRERPDPLATPGSFRSFVIAGDAAVLRGAPADALQAYGQAGRLRFPEWLMLRSAYLAGPAEGAQLAERYLAAFPDSLMAPRLIAAQTAQSGQWQRAAVLLANASRRQGQGDPRLLAQLASAQLQGGNALAALASAEAAYGLQRSSPIAAQALGLTLHHLGRDPERAARLIEKAAASRGGDPATQ